MALDLGDVDEEMLPLFASQVFTLADRSGVLFETWGRCDAAALERASA